MKLPIVNKEYNCFDDGKISNSRLYKVVIKEVIPFDKIDEDTLQQWQEEVKQCYWLYEKQTDYFIKAWNGVDVETFVRTKDKGWFSMGFLCAGRLDIDGTLTKSVKY